jgi:hypothetical protein
LYGISEETKADLKHLSQAHGVRVGTMVEPVLKKYVRLPENRKLIKREKNSGY